MATSADKRIKKWDIKFNTERVKETLDELRPDMLARVQAVFPGIVSMEDQVKQVLDGDGVSVIQYPFYLSFAREVWRLQRRGMSGESLALEVETLIAKWVARRLSQSVLETIRTQVFNVSAPVGP
jgi:hypothetical protein